MGQRANLILIEKGVHNLFYSHWCANTLPRDLFWGPEHAAAFIRIQRPVDESGWLDEVWAEGGAVVDFDRRLFLLYGGEDVLFNVPLRRVYLGLLAQVWAGWTIRWAFEGIADLADYVGFPRDKVLRDPGSDLIEAMLTPPEQNDWTDLVASVRLADGSIRTFPLQGQVPDYLAFGPGHISGIRPSDGLAELCLAEWTQEFPVGGYHADLGCRRLDFWLARDATDIANRVAQAWPDWRTEWHHDRYELQLERANGRLLFPVTDRETLLETCRNMLLRERSTSPVNSIVMLAERDRLDGKCVQVNPWAMREDHREIPREERVAILNKAMASLHRNDESKPP